jgi:hypothetical protein
MGAGKGEEIKKEGWIVRLRLEREMEARTRWGTWGL